jgi:hypothetical protein
VYHNLGVVSVFLLVVAVDPSYFNNNQRTLRAIVFWLQRSSAVAGWLWRFPQADQTFNLVIYKAKLVVD